MSKFNFLASKLNSEKKITLLKTIRYLLIALIKNYFALSYLLRSSRTTLLRADQKLLNDSTNVYLKKINDVKYYHQFRSSAQIITSQLCCEI